ncbi:unnamed protein product [Boreogadus saida]
MCIFPSEDTPGAELYSVYTEDAAGLDHVTLKDNLPARNRRSRQQEEQLIKEGFQTQWEEVGEVNGTGLYSALDLWVT